MEPIYFSSPAELRKWFEKNHAKEKELLVGYHKTSTGKPTISWSESVDQALCFGWIDGVRRSIDAKRYCIRFTPRKPTSIWSAINIAKITELTNKGLMTPAGMEAFKQRNEKKSEIYSYEKDKVELAPAFLKKFKSEKVGWKFFCAQPPSYQKPAINWVMSAKQEATRNSRLSTLIEDSEAGLRIKELRRDVKKKA